MGKTLAGWLLAALAAHAGTEEGRALNAAGHQLYLAARYTEAEAMYRRALQAFDAGLGARSGTPGSDAPQTLERAVTAENLGVTLRALGRFAAARELLETSLAQIQELTGPDSLHTAQALANLAALYWSSGNLAKAEATALQSEALFGNWPADRKRERANNRQVLASIYLAQRRYPEAIKLLHGALESADERTAVTVYGNLAVAGLGLGDVAQAEDYARRGVELAQRALPAAHPWRAVVINNLAQTCRFAGNYVEAEQLYREAIEIWETALGASHPDVGRGLMNLAAFYHERGRDAGAEQLYLRAAEILGRADAVLALVARNELADVLRAQLRYTESEKLARATLAEIERLMPAGDPRLVRALTNWAKLLHATKRSSEAAKVLSRLR